MSGDFRMGPWLVQPSLNAVSRNGKNIRLEPKVMEVLVCLARNAGEPVPKEKLLQTVWPNTFVTDDVLIRSISELRRSFDDDAKESQVIQTIPKRGYRLVLALEPLSGPSGKTSTSILASIPNEAREGQRKLVTGTLWFLGAGLVFGLLFALNLGGLRQRLLPKSSSPLIRSLAVLPLQNLSGDPAQAYFVDGMTEELITDLSQISALKVISRTSIEHYKNTNKPLPEIARELNVDGILEGSVRRSGDRVRISVQLVQARTDTHLWAESYEREMRDVLSLETNVARDIAQHIAVNLTLEQKERLARGAAANAEAHILYLKGRYSLNKYTEKGFLESIQYFKRAIDADPSDARAYAGLADAYYYISNLYLRPQEAIPKARAAATRAVKLDDTLTEAHTSLGIVKADYDWDWPGAEDEYKRAIELDPNYALAHLYYGMLLVIQGRFDRAQVELDHSEELDPLSPSVAVTAAWPLYFSGRYSNASARLRKIIQSDPDFPPAHESLGRVLEQMKELPEAISEEERAFKLAGSPIALARLGHAYAMAGRMKDSEQVLKKLKQPSAQGMISAYGIALVYVGRGEADEAFDWLEKAYQNRDEELVLVNVDPQFAALRSDLRFRTLQHRLNLLP